MRQKLAEKIAKLPYRKFEDSPCRVSEQELKRFPLAA
jgi:hypothetical protein